MLLIKGRPKNETGRLEKEIKVYDFLDKLDINYYRIDHNPSNSMEECEKIEVALETVICKNLLLCNRQHTQFYLMMMPAKKHFYTKVVSKIVGSSRLSFVEDEYLEELLNVTPGSVSIMGLMNDTDGKVQLLIDREVIENEYIGCHPCINTSSLKIPTKDILEKYLPAVNHKPMIIDLPYEINEKL